MMAKGLRLSSPYVLDPCDIPKENITRAVDCFDELRVFRVFAKLAAKPRDADIHSAVEAL